MSDICPLLRTADKRPRVAIFLSGSGSNAEQILTRWRADHASSFDIVALVTDRPDKSRALEIGEAFDVPVIAHDIKEFYLARGCKRITIATDEGRRIRLEWTDALRSILAPLRVDFGLFAGFVPLTNLTETLPCLNVHPGDLTYHKHGKRHLVGLHTVPIELAILEGLDHLRTSVILAESYSGKGDDMDSGPILGVSPKVMIDLQGMTIEQLREVAAQRQETRPVGGYRDALEVVAEHNQELLKRGGDWVVFPRVVWAFAGDCYGINGEGQLHYRQKGEGWQAVQSVIFTPDTETPIPLT